MHKKKRDMFSGKHSGHSNFIYNLLHRLGYHETVAITHDELMELIEWVEDGDAMVEEHEKAADAAYDRGHSDGFDACKSEELSPLLDQIWELLSCWDAKDGTDKEAKKLYAELPEGIEDVRNAAEDVQKRLKL